MAGETGPPKGPVPRRPPPKRAATPPPTTSAPPAQGPASLPPPPDAPVESVLTPRPPVARHDTSLFQLKEAVRIVRDPRSPQPEANLAQEPVARAGAGLGWEEPAGRPLPLPAIHGLSGVAPTAPTVRAPVAVPGAAWDRPAHPFAGPNSSDGDDGEAPAFDDPEPVAREERVSSVRQVVLLVVSLVVFLAAGGMAVYAVRATDLLGVTGAPAEGTAQAPPTAAGAVASVPATTPTIARQVEAPPEPEEPEREEDPPDEQETPADRRAERPAPTTPDPQKARPFEQLAADDAQPAPTAPRTEPVAKVEAEKPPPKPSSKGGALVLHGAANVGAIKVILICPSVPDRFEVVRPGGLTTVNGVSPSCSLRLQCMASSTSVQAKYLLTKTEATCQGCNKDRGDPVCQ